MGWLTEAIPKILDWLKILAPILVVYFVIRVASTLFKSYTNFIDALKTITVSKGRIFFTFVMIAIAIILLNSLLNRIGL